MFRFILFFTIALINITNYSLGATIKVPKDFPDIQLAINNSVSGDTILVASGTYMENIDFKGKDISLKSVSGPETTVIDGAASDYTVSFKNQEGPDCSIEGFTLKHGLCVILCEGSSPKIVNNIITDCKGALGTGVSCKKGSSPLIMGNRITNNIGQYKGGGIAVFEDCSPLITQNEILGNYSSFSGGGVSCIMDSSPEISNNIIQGNTSPLGAGINIEGASTPITIRNNFIHNNFSGDGIGAHYYPYKTRIHMIGNIVSHNDKSGVRLGWVDEAVFFNNLIHNNKGGGIDLGQCNAITFSNNTVAYNTTSFQGGGLYIHSSQPFTISNSIFWQNTAGKGEELYLYGSSLSIDHSVVRGGKSKIYLGKNAFLNWGSNMITNNPSFMNINDEDFHLAYNSPCRDSGDNSVPGLPNLDIDGSPRNTGGTVDMGADEFNTWLYYTGDAAPGGMVKLKVIGIPGTTPVHLWVGSGVLANAVLTPYGYWHLEYPIIFQLGLGTMSSPNGAIVIPYHFSPTAPPMTYPLQAFVGNELTNLCVIDLK